MDLPELNERRLFVRTPTGILLELVLRENGGQGAFASLCGRPLWRWAQPVGATLYLLAKMECG